MQSDGSRTEIFCQSGAETSRAPDSNSAILPSLPYVKCIPRLLPPFGARLNGSAGGTTVLSIPVLF